MLRRYLRYIEKEYQIRAGAARLTDGRVRPQVPTSGVWWSLVGMFALRLPSFNALEQELRRTGRWERLLGSRKPSADTLGYALSRFELSALRDLVREVNRKAWRRKAVHGCLAEPLRVVAMDGHELGASRARCCAQCLKRTVEEKGRPVTEYYHRAVVAQWVGVTPPGILDWELVRPGEGEVAAARRLWDRLVVSHGRLIDVVTLDALYLEGPFLRQVREAGKHFVAVLKQESRDLYRDAESLRSSLAPQILVDGAKTRRVWDIPGLTSFPTLGEPVRAVWSEEAEKRRRWVGGRREEIVEEKRWIWATDLPVAEVSASRVLRMGHARWDVENRGFNELVQLWNLDHCFVHDPVAMEAILLTLAIVFLTTCLFYERNLKPALRRRMTRLSMAARMAEDFLTPEPFWPEPQLSGQSAAFPFLGFPRLSLSAPAAERRCRWRAPHAVFQQQCRRRRWFTGR